MASYRLSVDLSDLFASNDAIGEAIFPRVAQAVRAVAEEGAFRWKQRVMHARLWSGEKIPYVESIGWKSTGPFAAEIFTDYKLAGEIERGRPGRDLKEMLQTSRKTRIAKHGPNKGKRYLIIPMRHNTPGGSGEGAMAPQMPSGVYALARNLAPSSLLPPGSVKPKTRVSASGHHVAQHSYSWGGSLPGGLVPKLSPSHHSDPYAGMARFKEASGGSTYLTFRVMMEGSPKWLVKPKDGLYLARSVSVELQPLLEGAVAKAVSF